ncbi:hypothetical protein ACXAUS_000665 [Clostridium sporogenes]|uniref:hypothetical protein n=1 Tax=Clostridium sporogenes TaxID=1509 RepID=UPI0029048928|nr:hypothetical protein [Clostridium botulinum]
MKISIKIDGIKEKGTPIIIKEQMQKVIRYILYLKNLGKIILAKQISVFSKALDWEA